MRQATVDVLLVESNSTRSLRNARNCPSRDAADLHFYRFHVSLRVGRRPDREGVPSAGKKVVVKLQAAERADEVFSAALSQLVSCVKEGIVSASRCAEDSDCVVKRGNARESKGRGGCIHPSKLVGQPGN